MKRMICLAVAVALSSPSFHVSAADEERTLEIGIRQLNEGDLAQAVITLDAVIQRLTPEAAAHAQELSQAHLYKGIALVGLQQEEPAKAAFREALKQDPTLRLRTDKFSRQVVRVFDAARQGKTKSVMEPPSTVPKKAGIGGLGIAAIVGGAALLAGGAAVAASTSGSQANQPPATPTLTVSPTGDAVTAVTRMTFSAQGSDPDGDAVTYAWNFGDGSDGQGQTITHVFQGEGSFTVRLTVTDPSGASATASTTVNARTVTGEWVDSLDPHFVWTFAQNGSALVGSLSWVTAGLVRIGPVTGALTDPRSINFSVTVEWESHTRGGTTDSTTYLWEGTLDDTLQTISAVYRGCSVPPDNQPCTPSRFVRQ